MIVYFSCAITGGRQFEAVYQAIAQALLEDGHEVPTARLATSEVKVLEAAISPREAFERDMAWIRACHVLVAEVSTPSHGVGIEIAQALTLDKPVLCCYQAEMPVSKLICGNSHPKIQVKAYQDIHEAVVLVRDFVMASIDTL